VQEIDYGTPRSKSEKMVSLSIDGKQISDVIIQTTHFS
jgi:hypothetical protein